MTRPMSDAPPLRRTTLPSSWPTVRPSPGASPSKRARRSARRDRSCRHRRTRPRGGPGRLLPRRIGRRPGAHGTIVGCECTAASPSSTSRGSLTLTEFEGDERAVDVLTAFRALLRDICARRGVRIAKWLGDGAMLVCVDTRPLLETVLEIHYVVTEVSGPVKTVSIRSGISSGDVILMEGDDYVGHCVNVASRLCDLAPSSEAWATPTVMEHLPSWGVAAAPDLRQPARRGEASAGLEHPDGGGRRGRRDAIPSADFRSPTTPRRRSRTTSGDRSCCSAQPVVSTPGDAGRARVVRGRRRATSAISPVAALCRRLRAPSRGRAPLPRGGAKCLIEGAGPAGVGDTEGDE